MSFDTKSNNYQSLLKDAYMVIEDMQARLESLEGEKHEPIAIVGMGCRFPGGANDAESFWQVLINGIDTVTEVPPERWDVDEFYDPDPDAPGKSYSRWGAFVKDIDQFDADFFRISPREVANMDPKQRLLLEVAWEALEDAGMASKKVFGSQTGVFMGVSSYDYLFMQAKVNDPKVFDAYSSTGVAYSIAAGRLSYFFDFHGPNSALDTACSSSLVATHLACQSLRLKECDMAMAGGVNLVLIPEGMISISRARMVSFDGHCKAFDASADGYVRGEGCGIVVLKRLSDALANGDRILAVIHGTAINQDGRSNGLTAPNGLAQEAVIRAAIADAGIHPREVNYIEAHGTGTSLGDPIELRALQAVYGIEHSQDNPLYVGSVKTNIGHLEGAAGVAGLIKLVLSFKHRQIPPHLHFHSPNPLIPWEQMPVVVPTQPVEWVPPEGKRLIGGVSSFGYSGTNAHLVLSEAPPQEEKVNLVDRSHHVLTLSAKSEAALKELTGRYLERLAASSEKSFPDLCYTANTGRRHFTERLAVLASTPDQAHAHLSAWLSGEEPTAVWRGTQIGNTSPQAAFLFTGQGSQYNGMGRQLYETQPAFREALNRCDEYLRPYLPRPLLSVFFPEDGADAGLIDQTAYTQPALFAIEYALAQLWSAWGVEPGIVAGHSVGEYVAACLAGVFSLEDGLKLIAARGRLMQDLPQGGTMAAVFAPEEQVASACAPYLDQVSIAAVNGPANIVVSGAAAAVRAVLDNLEAEGIKTKPLVVSHAFHSPLMDPILEAFAQVAASVSFSEPQLGLVSNVTGRMAANSDLTSADYWVRHVRAPVRFADSMQTLSEQGYKLFLEIGPQPTLLGMGRRCLPAEDLLWLPSLRPGRPDWQQMLESLAVLYTTGLEIDWDGFDKEFTRSLLALPTYPFQRQRFWVDLPRASTQPHSKGRDNGSHPLLERRLRSPLFKGTLFESDLSIHAPAYLTDHRFYGTPIFPAAGYLEMGLAAAARVMGPGAHALEEIVIREALILGEEKPSTVQAALSVLENDQAAFDVYSLDENANGDWKLHTTAKILSNPSAQAEELFPSLEELRSRCTQEVPVQEYYQQVSGLGAEYGPTFQGITGLWRGAGEGLSYLELPQPVRAQASDYQLHPALLDAAFQILGAAFPEDIDSHRLYVPVGMERYQVYQPGLSQAWAHASLRSPSDEMPAEAFIADLTLYDGNGGLAARINGLQLRKVNRADIWRAAQKRFDEWLYEVEWLPKSIDQPDQVFDASGVWLILDGCSETGADLAERLHSAGAECILVQPGAEFQASENGPWIINPARAEDFHRLLAEALEGRELDYRGSVYLWALSSGQELSLPALRSHLEVSNSGLLHLVQALAERSETVGLSMEARLWVVTQGSQSLGSGVPTIAQAPVWGLANTISNEHPELLCTRVDLDPHLGVDSLELLLQEIKSPGDEDQVVWRGRERYAARFVHLQEKSKQLVPPENQPFELDISERGILDNLILRPTQRSRPGPGEVEIRIQASGLNFRDVLNVLGMYPGPAGPVGTECSGVVVEVGEGVETFSPGDKVIALGSGTFRSHLVTSERFVYPTPPQFTSAQAASIPIAFLTAYYGLHNLAEIKPGDRVLIHAAAGGVGIAAVQLARQAGAVIFGTAGSPEKRAYLESIGVDHIMSSRTLDFAGQIMEITQGEGVDIVLNALADEFIPKSLSVLADHGRFLEIGKRGIWNEAQVAELNSTLQYYAYDLAQVLQEDPGFVKRTLDILMPAFEAGVLKPLPMHTFTMPEIVDAFRFMAQARHTGKIVITQPVGSDGTGQITFEEDATYLLTGGLGGLGRAIAGGMIRRGARHLIMVSRKQPSAEAREWLAQAEQAGSQVVTIQCDVSIESEVAAALQQIEEGMPPLRGVIHAAGVLDDGVIRSQTWTRFETVLAPKVYGAWNLHCLTREKQLDFFILFSSMASLLGSSGQSNYAAANAFLDSLAHYRRGQGLPAMSINWGPWSEAGMASGQSSRENQRWWASGVTYINPEEGIQVFERLLKKNRTQAGVFPADWSQLSRQFSDREVPPFLHGLFRQNTVSDQNGHTPAHEKFINKLEAAPLEDRFDLIQAHIQEQVIRVLGLDPSQQVDPLRGLSDLGMDSLMTVELSNRLKFSLNQTLPTTLAFEYPTISALTNFLANDLLSEMMLEPTPAGEEVESLSVEMLSELENMSDAEVEDTLLQELDEIGY